MKRLAWMWLFVLAVFVVTDPVGVGRALGRAWHTFMLEAKGGE